MQLTYFDLAVTVILLIFAVRGAMRGFIAEMSGLVGLAAGLVLARTFFHETTEFMSGFIAPDAAPAVAFVTLFIAGMLVVGLIARLLRRVLDLAFAGWVDSVLGVGAGLVKSIILCALLAYAALMFVPHFHDVRDSRLIPYLMEGVRYFVSAMNLNVPMP